MRGKNYSVACITVQRTKASMFCEVPDAISLDLWALIQVNLDPIQETEPIVGWTLFSNRLCFVRWQYYRQEFIKSFLYKHSIEGVLRGLSDPNYYDIVDVFVGPE